MLLLLVVVVVRPCHRRRINGIAFMAFAALASIASLCTTNEADALYSEFEAAVNVGT